MRVLFSYLILALILFFIFAPDICQAQIDADVNNNLIFGTVFPGIPKVISKQSAGSAAEFSVAGTAGAEITIDFTLPTYINQGGSNMNVIFTETDCSMDSSSTPDQSNPGLNNQDPWHTITYNLGSNGLLIWLGATLIPGLSQTSGDYSGLIVLTVAYTGS